MNIWEIDKLVLFILFVIPGFVTLKLYDLMTPGEYKDSAKRLIDAIAYSCIIYAILFVPISFIEARNVRNSYPLVYYLFYLFVFFLAPVCLVFLWQWVRRKHFFQAVLPHPSNKPWDYVFAQRKPYWIKVRFEDGTTVAGKYGANSFASSAPAGEQIYLEECWMLNEQGAFERAKNRSAGILIVSKILSIEMFEG